MDASGRSARWLAGLMAGSAAMILVSTLSFSHISQRNELFMRKNAGEGDIAYGEGGVGGAYGAWKDAKVVAEGTKHSPLKLDFSAPLDKYTRLSATEKKYAKGLDYQELAIHTRLDLPEQGYASGFPHSYFESAPNPDARYAWVCPGPSKLYDPHSGTCPQSDTTGFRCCMDVENGGAVADDMCCPRKETQLTPHAERISKEKLSDKLSNILLKIVEKLEKEEQPQPSNDFTASQASADIDNYFDKLGSKQTHEARSMSAENAQQDLKKFFKLLKKGDIGGLLPEPEQQPAAVVPQPEDERIIHKVANNVAGKLVRSEESASVRMQREQFQQWKDVSEGDGEESDDFTKAMTKEQEKQRMFAEKKGEETAREWAGHHEHFYTDIRGNVPASFARTWGVPERGSVTVPTDDVQSS